MAYKNGDTIDADVINNVIDTAISANDKASTAKAVADSASAAADSASAAAMQAVEIADVAKENSSTAKDTAAGANKNANDAIATLANLKTATTTLPPGAPATSGISGTIPNLTLNLAIPRGESGEGSGDSTVYDNSGKVITDFHPDVWIRENHLKSCIVKFPANTQGQWAKVGEIDMSKGNSYDNYILTGMIHKIFPTSATVGNRQTMIFEVCTRRDSTALSASSSYKKSLLTDGDISIENVKVEFNDLVATVYLQNMTLSATDVWYSVKILSELRRYPDQYPNLGIQLINATTVEATEPVSSVSGIVGGKVNEANFIGRSFSLISSAVTSAGYYLIGSADMTRLSVAANTFLTVSIDVHKVNGNTSTSSSYARIEFVCRIGGGIADIDLSHIKVRGGLPKNRFHINYNSENNTFEFLFRVTNAGETVYFTITNEQITARNNTDYFSFVPATTFYGTTLPDGAKEGVPAGYADFKTSDGGELATTNTTQEIPGSKTFRSNALNIKYTGDFATRPASGDKSNNFVNFIDTDNAALGRFGFISQAHNANGDIRTYLYSYSEGGSPAGGGGALGITTAADGSTFGTVPANYDNSDNSIKILNTAKARQLTGDFKLTAALAKGLVSPVRGSGISTIVTVPSDGLYLVLSYGPVVQPLGDFNSLCFILNVVNGKVATSNMCMAGNTFFIVQTAYGDRTLQLASRNLDGWAWTTYSDVVLNYYKLDIS